jgi:hypothetical protein
MYVCAERLSNLVMMQDLEWYHKLWRWITANLVALLALVFAIVSFFILYMTKKNHWTHIVLFRQLSSTVFFSLRYKFLFSFFWTWPTRPLFLRVHLWIDFVSFTLFFLLFSFTTINKKGSVWIGLAFFEVHFEKLFLKKSALQKKKFTTAKKICVSGKKVWRQPIPSTHLTSDPWYAKWTLLQSLRYTFPNEQTNLSIPYFSLFKKEQLQKGLLFKYDLDVL